ncbi:hypothetical protein [Rhodoferax mekongensis]|uniref:Uncharacterized protein n=1 Tax=Rhodoferax mekongensis TaxID=3068341 RepID=A0ABZ0B350_9BURK|nr:hypothetical protein [Rhodoferax sp. TBRC 17307]WNO06050.1 hypothetical protein RAN89_06365 [Rhodoferax sp. TBRC 17307]
MTFLELCRSLVEKSSITGAISSVENQRGEMLRVVNWINEAWWEIQLKNTNWRWMTYEFQFTTQVGVATYDPTDPLLGLTRFRRWRPDTFRIQKRSAGLADNHDFTQVDWPTFRAQYIFAPVQPQYPAAFGIHPRTSALVLGPSPDDFYDVFGDYQRSPYRLSSNTDVPDMPDEFHMLIVHMARQKYAAYENAAEVLAEAMADGNSMMNALTEDQLDQVGLGVPLA